MNSDLMTELVPMVLTHAAAFLLFVWVLKKFALGPVLSILDERRNKISAKFDDIDAAEKRLASLREDYEEKLREIDEEARQRTLEEVARGRRIAEEIAENARREGAEQIEKAKTAIRIQTDQARVEIKQEVVSMALAAAERLIREKLDDRKHRELVGSFIDELEGKSLE